MKVGFIGLGSMGLPMAQRIQADPDHDLVLWARREAALEPFAGTSATIAATPAELGEQVDAVGVCVYDGPAVDEVVFGPDGLTETMKPGAVIIVHSTVSPGEMITLAEKAGARGLRLLDAPVSGGQPKASIGELTVMIGGDEQTLRDVEGVLAAFSDHIVHLGDVGAASRAKLINNAMFSAQIALADDAMAAGVSLGVDPAGLADILSRSSSSCVASTLRIRTGSMRGVLGTQAHVTLLKDIALFDEQIGTDAGSQLADAARRFVVKVEEAQQ